MRARRSDRGCFRGGISGEVLRQGTRTVSILIVCGWVQGALRGSANVPALSPRANGAENAKRMLSQSGLARAFKGPVPNWALEATMRTKSLTVVVLALLTASLGAQREGAQAEGAPREGAGQEAAPAGASREAKAILRDFDSVSMPAMSAGSSPEARREFRAAIAAACSKKAELALELHRQHPGHRRVPELMAVRWASMSNALDRAADVVAETAALLKETTAPELRVQAALAAARAVIVLEDVPFETRLSIVESACQIAPDEEQAAIAMLDLAKYHCADVATMRRLCERVAEKWAGSAWSGRRASAVLKQLERIGKPIELEFVDLVGGERQRSADWVGKPYVIHIWSTTTDKIREECAAIRNYRARHGLQVVGIRTWRHRDGEDALRKELQQLGQDWPQYYAYEPGSPPVSGPWATGETPLYILVDEKGLASAISYRFANIAKALQAEADPPQRRERL